MQSLSSTGVLSVKDANHHIEARKEEEDQGMRRRAVKRGARFRTNQTPTDENDPRMERIPVDGDDVFFGQINNYIGYHRWINMAGSISFIRAV